MIKNLSKEVALYIKIKAVQSKCTLLRCHRSNDADNIIYNLKSMTNIELEYFTEYVFIYLIYF